MLQIKKKKDVTPEETTEEKEIPIVVSEEFDKLSVLVKNSLAAFRQGVENLSMKEMRRLLIASVESPLENTVYKTDKNGNEVFPSSQEESILKLARAVKFWQFQMFFEHLKNPDKLEEIKAKVEEFNKEQQVVTESTDTTQNEEK